MSDKVDKSMETGSETDNLKPWSQPGQKPQQTSDDPGQGADQGAQKDGGGRSAKSKHLETIGVVPDDGGLRLDRWFKRHFPDVTHGRLRKMLRTGQIRVDGKRVQANLRLSVGSQIRVPKIAREPLEQRPSLRPPPGLSKADRTFIENMILFEDDDVFVLNKPFGLAVQGGTKTTRHLDGILAGMADRFGGERPRLVHRLDRDTTGVLLVAKSRFIAAKLGKTFQTRSAAKTYWALVTGVPRPHQGKVEAALVKATTPDGDRVRKSRPGEQKLAQHATTHYSVIDRVGNKAAWVSLKPVTGRQHQLRAHMQIIECPIVGDNKYGGDEMMPDVDMEVKLHLHARRLVLPHPRDQSEKVDVTAPLPEHMLRTWDLLGLDPNKFDADEG